MSTVNTRIIGDCRLAVGPYDITPASSHLFALLLFLALADSRRTSRSELQLLLFGEPLQGSGDHRLRQLFYRVRSLGVTLEVSPLGVRLDDEARESPLSALRALTAEARASLAPAALDVLPGYSATLTNSYGHWLDQVRHELTRSIVRLLHADIQPLRAKHHWEGVSQICAHIVALDPLNDYVTQVGAEALAMLGRRDDALDLIDTFMHSSEGASAPSELHRLRRRLSSTHDRLRSGTLRGRADCLAHLSQEWHSAVVGGARLVTLLGPPGIGKSRVIHEFAASVDVSGGKVLQHKCDPPSQQYPLSLFAQLLPSLRAMRGSIGISPQHAELLSRLVPSAGNTRSVASGVALELLRSDLDAALLDLLEAVSGEQPLLLTIDDAHFLDDTSCAVLRHIASTGNSAAILLVTCWRPRDRVATLPDAPSRSSSHHLLPLNDEDARALITELTPKDLLRESRTQWCIEQSGGNPLFLHSLSRVGSEHSPVPFDITSVATASYFGLGESSRLVLESCLYLNSLATLSRLSAVTDLDDLALASALRELELLDLVTLQGSVVRGPHSLLDESLRSLVPTTVAAMVHKRIATVLTKECHTHSYSVPVALAAARSWIAFGDLDSAEYLLRRCAADIASIGDPSKGAELLGLVAFNRPTDDKTCALLDELIRYADAGGARSLALQGIRERLHLARLLNHSSELIRQLEFRLIEADVFSGLPLEASVAQLTCMLSQPDLSDDLRLQCIATLLIIADAEYDAPLAEEAARLLSAIAPPATRQSANGLRALLIYHTTFGDQREAIAIASTLVRRFPYPDITEECRTARRFASFALYRLLNHTDATSLLVADYEYMARRGVRSEALYAASLLTEIEIASGNFASARAWFELVQAQLNGGVAHKLAPNSGFYSSAALFAMMDGDFLKADQLLAIPLQEDPRMRTRRYSAILTALSLRCAMLRGTLSIDDPRVSNLRELFLVGRRFGGQDTVAETLWCANIVAGREAEASALLNSYLSEHRREAPPIEWSLRSTTAADDFWNQEVAEP